MKSEKQPLQQNISNAKETIAKGAGEVAIGLPLLLVGTQLILNNILHYTPDVPADYLSIGIAVGTTMLGYFPVRSGVVDIVTGNAELQANRLEQVRQAIRDEIEVEK